MSAAADTSARVGFCAVVGLPNVGKSTLLNQILGVRLVAVSPKPQTTRNRIVGVHNTEVDGEPAQLVIVDTPGIQKGKGALRKYMREQALAAAGECDVAVLMVDVSDRRFRTPEALAGSDAAALGKAVAAAGAPVILALNKVDRLRDKGQILPIIEAFAAAGGYEAIVPISALNGDGTGALAEEVARRLPRGPRLFPDDMITDRAERFLAAELIREQLFRQLGAELPYATAVRIESFRERPDKDDVVIEAVVFVERESQKGIVVGRGGARVKEVGQRAREAIAELFGCPVHLKLYVKVSREWSRDKRGIREMGYE